MKFTIKGYEIFPRETFVGTEGSFGRELIELEFGEDWEGLGVTVSFLPAGSETGVSVLWTGEPFVMPPEVTATRGRCKMAVVGNDDESRAITVCAELLVGGTMAVQEGLSEAVTPTLYEQLVAAITALAINNALLTEPQELTDEQIGQTLTNLGISATPEHINMISGITDNIMTLLGQKADTSALANYLTTQQIDERIDSKIGAAQLEWAGVILDSAINAESDNAVKNRAIAAALLEISPESHTHTVEALTDNESYVRMTAAERLKLQGIEDQANKYTHPASHAISDVSGLSEALAGKSPSGHTHDKLEALPTAATLNTTLTDHNTRITTLEENTPEPSGSSITVGGSQLPVPADFPQVPDDLDQGITHVFVTVNAGETVKIYFSGSPKIGWNGSESIGSTASSSPASHVYETSGLKDIAMTAEPGYFAVQPPQNGGASFLYGSSPSVITAPVYIFIGKNDYIFQNAYQSIIAAGSTYDALYGLSGLRCLYFANPRTNDIISYMSGISNSATQQKAQLSVVEFPVSITIIWQYAFEGCSALTDLTFYSLLFSIQQYAFKDCTGLKQLHFRGNTPPTFNTGCLPPISQFDPGTGESYDNSKGIFVPETALTDYRTALTTFYGQSYADAVTRAVRAEDGSWESTTEIITASDQTRKKLVEILREGTYGSDQTDNINALALGLGVAHSVTLVLNGASSSNTASIVDDEESYTTTITANPGHTMNSVVVKMGGVNITSTAYDSSTGVVSIASVTGDISITADAYESQ